MKVFYAEDGVIGSRDMEWILESLNVLIGLFCWILAISNVAKSKKNDVSAVGNQIRNVGGCGWTEKYRERRYLPGKAVV